MAGAKEYSSTLPLKLEAGKTYTITVDYSVGVGDLNGIIELRWSSPSTQKKIVPQSILYSPGSGGAADDVLFDVLVKTYRLLHKTASLVDGFNLLVKELGYMTTHSSDFNGFDPNVLPLDRTIDPDTIDRNALTLFNQWETVFTI